MAEEAATASDPAGVSGITGEVDVLYNTLDKTKEIKTREFAKLSTILNEAFKRHDVSAERRPTLLSHLPKHFYEDVPEVFDDNVALMMILRGLRVYPIEHLDATIRGLASVDSLSPFKAVKREEARAEVTRAAQNAVREMSKNDEAAATMSQEPERQLHFTPAPAIARTVSFQQTPHQPPSGTQPITQPQTAAAVTAPTLETMRIHDEESRQRDERSSSRRHRRAHSDTSSDSSVDSEAGFEHPKILLEPKRWQAVMDRDPRGSLELQRQLRAQLLVDKLCVTQPGRWTTHVAEDLCIALTSLVEGNDQAVATRLLQVLWRFRGFAEGATPQAIEDSVKTLRSHALPREYRDATKKLKTSTKSGETQGQQKKGSFRKDAPSKPSNNSKPAVHKE